MIAAVDQPVPRRVVPLTQLRDGSRARVHQTNLCCEDCALLNAMGLTDQCELRVCQAGRACIVQVHNTRIGLSADVARNIFVSATEER